jgi:hypothetical protein
MVRFIDDDHVPATGRQFPKRTFAAFHEVDRGNNSRLDAPGISAGFQRAARFGDALAVEDTKFKPKLCRELGLPPELCTRTADRVRPETQRTIW